MENTITMLGINKYCLVHNGLVVSEGNEFFIKALAKARGFKDVDSGFDYLRRNADTVIEFGVISKEFILTRSRIIF